MQHFTQLMAPFQRSYNKISPEIEYTVRALVQVSGWSVAKIKKEKPSLVAGIPSATLYRIAKKPLGQPIHDSRIKNKGRPPLMTCRDTRRVIKEITHLQELNIAFNSLELQTCLNITNMSNLTFRRHLKIMGYQYLTSRRKGLMTREDKKKRVAFAKEIKGKYKTLDEQTDFWRNGISMYTDIVGFEFKRNPYALATAPGARAWRKRGQGLRVTRKGSKEGITCLKFLVGISYNRGVTMIKHIMQQLNGPLYAYIIRENTFENGVANTDSRTIIQDGDPSQNSSVAVKAFTKKKIKLFGIPARSPDINVIENLFHKIKKDLNADAKKHFLKKETKEQFQVRVERIIQNVPHEYVNNLIDSLPKRMDQLIIGSGDRLKY